jgi:CO/xanthine dehydrogenase Mo-binding subunit
MLRSGAAGRHADRSRPGLAWSRYKNKAAYACVAVELDVDLDITLRRVWCATDAGLVINPDGVRNQLEGGIVHATVTGSPRWIGIIIRF